jgi:hypothetical protein
MIEARYAKRENAFQGAEQVFTAASEGLSFALPVNGSRFLAWSDIVHVRIAFAATRLKPWRHVLVLMPRRGKPVSIDNGHFRGLADFENRTASYRPFVEAVLAHLTASNPDLPARRGETPAGYWALMACMVFGLGCVGLALFAFPTPLDGAPILILIKLGLIVWMLPMAGQWAWKARPGKFTVSTLPEAILPPLNQTS